MKELQKELLKQEIKDELREERIELLKIVLFCTLIFLLGFMNGALWF